MGKSNIETNYNRHVKNARAFAKYFSGYERAEKISQYFSQNGHPHADYTFNQMAINRSSNKKFAVDIIKAMASLVAENEMLEAEL
jgi:hypothetical protein